MQGITVLDRPHESAQSDKFTRFHPFVSTVTTNLNPIGLPPIKKEFLSSNNIDGKRILKENPIYKRNRRIIKKLEKLNQMEKKIEDEELKKQLKKKTQVRNIATKANKEIEEMRKNLYSSSDLNEINFAENNFTKEKDESLLKKKNCCLKINNNNNSGKFKLVSNTKNNIENNVKDEQNLNLENVNNKNDIKDNPKYKYIKDKLEKANEREIDELVYFAQNLDYNKYIKELETREALNLVKIKFDEENAKKENEQLENNIDINNSNTENKEQEKKADENEEENKDKNNLVLPPIESKETKEAEHIRDWGVRQYINNDILVYVNINFFL